MLLALVSMARSLLAGANTTDSHARLPWKECSSGGPCPIRNDNATVDSNWRWSSIIGEVKKCHDANLWSDRYCPDDPTCDKNCGLDDTDPVQAIGDGLMLEFAALGQYSTNVGSRLYRLGDAEPSN
jgi:cellulose 1,4-beta-cellobiosidase